MKMIIAVLKYERRISFEQIDGLQIYNFSIKYVAWNAIINDNNSGGEMINRTSEEDWAERPRLGSPDSWAGNNTYPTRELRYA